jgi:hypothetical protein
MNTRRVLCALIITGAVAAGSSVPLVAAHAADVSVNFNAGDVAFGFTDGYWDRNHAWHAWPNTKARDQWRSGNAAHYHAKSHAQYKGSGWSDSDRYWEHH